MTERKGLARRKREDVLDVLNSDRDADLIRPHTGSELLSRRQLLMRRRARLKNERVNRTDVGELGVKLERVDDLGTLLPVLVALDTEGQDATVAVLDEELERGLVVRVRLEPGVRDPPVAEREIFVSTGT